MFVQAAITHEKCLRNYYRAKGYNEFVHHSSNEMLSVQAMQKPIAVIRGEGAGMLEEQMKSKGASNVAYTMFSSLQKKLLSARAKKLLVEMYRYVPAFIIADNCG